MVVPWTDRWPLRVFRPIFSKQKLTQPTARLVGGRKICLPRFDMSVLRCLTWTPRNIRRTAKRRNGTSSTVPPFAAGRGPQLRRTMQSTWQIYTRENGAAQKWKNGRKEPPKSTFYGSEILKSVRIPHTHLSISRGTSLLSIRSLPLLAACALLGRAKCRLATCLAANLPSHLRCPFPAVPSWI